jgi:hypothetical protein
MKSKRHLAIMLVIAALGMAVIAAAYWPGIMIDDARWQYQQSVDNAYEDWHPVLMAWIWHYLMAIEPGPAPMFLLQLLLYWTGIASIAAWLWSQGMPRFGIAAACAGWLPAPFALLGSVTKDALMAGTLGCAVGFLLWSKTAGSRSSRMAFATATFAALFLAAALRVNAFLACVPLALAALPSGFSRTLPRAALTVVASATIFFGTPGLIAAALHAEDTDSKLSLIIFDLGGITENSGVSQFPDFNVPNPVAANHHCYDPTEWDSYSTWAHRPCPLGFDRFQALVDQGDVDVRMIWLRSILSHPLAYAEHRLAHFNLSTWFLVPEGPDFTAWTESVPNPWNFQVTQNPLLSAVDAVTNAFAETPLGWPSFWIALALAILVGCRLGRLRGEATAVAASAFFYGAGYLVFGVATGMRYYVWTITGAAIAAILAAAELSRRSQRLNRRGIGLPAAIVVIPTGMAAIARLVL